MKSVFEHLIQTVSSYPASTFCLASSFPVEALITKFPAEYVPLHPEALITHVEREPQVAESAFVKKFALVAATTSKVAELE